MVDEEDFARLLQYRWLVSDRGYVVSTCHKRMHRLIANAKEGEEVDHVNGNKLDNRRKNLRTVTRQQNTWNVRPRKNKKSQYKGVEWDSRLSLWRASIMNSGVTYRSRRMRSEEEAARWYDGMAIKLRGTEHTYLNFPS